jgi:hypothetical protein
MLFIGQNLKIIVTFRCYISKYLHTSYNTCIPTQKL